MSSKQRRHQKDITPISYTTGLTDGVSAVLEHQKNPFMSSTFPTLQKKKNIT